MSLRTLPSDIFLPSNTDRSLATALRDMYRLLVGRIKNDEQDIAAIGTSGFAVSGGDLTIQNAQGAMVALRTFREVVSTTATPTDTAANLLPANSIILAVTVRVLTGLTGTLTTFTVGDPTTAGRFATAVSKALNTTAVGILQWSGAVTTLAAGPSQAAAARVRIAATSGTLTAGSVEVTVHALVFTAPTS